MKKILFIALAAIMSVGASAQEISTKAPSQKIHYVNAAIGFLNLSGDAAKGTNSTIGFDVYWGYEKPLGYGIWWGQEIGIGTSRGCDFGVPGTDSYFRTYSIRYTPANFGYRYRINHAWAVEGHVGVGVSFDFAGSQVFGPASTSIWDVNDYRPLDVTLKLGAGFTYKHFGFDISWQKGFVNYIKDANASASNVFLGVRFVY